VTIATPSNRTFGLSEWSNPPSVGTGRRSKSAFNGCG
jgi:hypothetical protein